MSTVVSVLTACICLLSSAATPALATPDARLECPAVVMAERKSGGWTVLVQDGAFLAIATKWDAHDSGREFATASFVSTQVRPEAEPETGHATAWIPVAEAQFGFDLVGYLPSLGAVAAEDGEQVYVVEELASSAKYVAWTALPRSRFAGLSQSTTAVGGTPPAPRAETLYTQEWRRIHEIRGEDASAFGWDLCQPSVTSLRGKVMLAGDGLGPASAGHVRGIWVAPLAEPQDRAIEAVILGPGWKPALVPAGESLFCLAIHKEGWRALDDFRGSVVAWRSADGAEWEPWEPGVPLDNVVRVDGCTEGDMTLVACLTAPPEQRIHVYRLGSEKEGLKELLTVDPAPEGELGRDIAIRLLKGKPYLFWQDNVGDDPHSLFGGNHVGNVKTYIVIRRLELAALEDAAGAADETHPDDKG